MFPLIHGLMGGGISESLYALTNDAGTGEGRADYYDAVIDGNSFSYIIPESPTSTEANIGIDIGWDGSIPLWSGKRAIEFQLTKFEGSIEYTGLIDPSFYPNAWVGKFSGDSDWAFYGDDSQPAGSPHTAGNFSVIGIVLDGTTGDAEFFFDGVSQGTATTAFPLDATSVAFTLFWNGGNTPGEGIEGEVRTLAADYAYTYGVGVSDFQGNPM